MVKAFAGRILRLVTGTPKYGYVTRRDCLSQRQLGLEYMPVFTAAVPIDRRPCDR